jgi:hypothetical protein
LTLGCLLKDLPLLGAHGILRVVEALAYICSTVKL